MAAPERPGEAAASPPSSAGACLSLVLSSCVITTAKGGGSDAWEPELKLQASLSQNGQNELEDGRALVTSILDSARLSPYTDCGSQKDSPRGVGLCSYMEMGL